MDILLSTLEKIIQNAQSGCLQPFQMDIGKVEQEWGFRGFSCALWTDPPGQVWENFVHEVDELLMVVQGKLEMEMEGSVLHPGIGEEIFISANVLHTVRNLGGTTARWLYGYKIHPS